MSAYFSQDYYTTPVLSLDHNPDRAAAFSTYLVNDDHENTWLLTCKKIPAKKWGDTEIAERGRSVLVMRARYKSAGLTPHQRGWTDAGW